MTLNLARKILGLLCFLTYFIPVLLAHFPMEKFQKYHSLSFVTNWYMNIDLTLRKRNIVFNQLTYREGNFSNKKLTLKRFRSGMSFLEWLLAEQCLKYTNSPLKTYCCR